MKKNIIVIVFLITTLIGASVFVAKEARAQSALAPFGGVIYHIKRCTCPIPGFLVWVSGPVGGPFLYVPAVSQLFMNFGILSMGSWVLGLHTNIPNSCGNYDEGFCEHQVPARGIMTMVGTS